ncbi:MAG TPA: AAA family ATPase [Spirochaetota bacterium]|nr:AAA family ATPase [Spirochaetota bacterium]
MDKLVIAGTRKSAGKTTIFTGLGKALGKKVAYMKPFGDRLIYRKKRLWDYDAALLTNIFGLEESPEDITIGFEHAKLRYVYDEERVKEKLHEIANNVGKNKEMLFVEGGRDLAYGVSVYLDAISVAHYLDGKLVLVVGGNDDNIVDDITLFKKYVDVSNVDFAGVIINKVHDIEDFKNTYVEKIKEMGVNVIGIIPYVPELSYFTMDYLSETLFAKVIAGEAGLNSVVKNIFVGAMSSNEALRNPMFNKDSKLLITSGDRSDMILSGLETNTAGIILTNNILPPSNIISKASEKNIPLLLVSSNTYQVASQLEKMEALLTKDNAEKVSMIEKLIADHVDVKLL